MVGCNGGVTPPNNAPVITTTTLPAATVGTEYTATVKATDADGDDLTFSLVSGPPGMVISEAGDISGWTPDEDEVGTVAVKVAVNDGIETVSAPFIITVSEAEVAELTGIEVVPGEMNLFEGGDPETIDSVTATYSDGFTADIALKDCTYVSSNTKVATVDAGVVTAVAKGSATITVSYTEEKITKTVYIEETDTLEVTVSAVEVDHIVVLPEDMTLYSGGVESASKTIESITAYNNDGTDFEVDFVDYCTYGLNPMGIVEVEDDKVTADKVGKTTLTINYEGKTDTIEVTVLAYKLDYIVVVPDTMDFDEDWLEDSSDSETITSVTAYYNDGTDVVVALGDCDYKSSNEDVATFEKVVDVVTVTAVAKGSAIITISYEGIGEDVTAEALIEVTVSNRKPSITTPELPAASEGILYTFNVDAEDPDGDTITYSLPICPSGMEINSISGQITWDPVVEDSGEVVTVGVTDDDKLVPLSDTKDFTITVTE